MRRVSRALLPTLLALVGACDRGDEPSSMAISDSAAMAEDPRHIYGPPASDIVRVVPVEMDMRNLPSGWSGMRIAAISDLHLGVWPDNERVAAAAVQKALEARPDLIVLLGDYVGPRGDFAALERVLAPLRGRPVMAVLGDMDEVAEPEAPDTLRARTTQTLERLGIRVLRNARAPHVHGGDTAYIGGLEPFLARRPAWRQAEVYGGMPGDSLTPLILSHMPVAAVTLPGGRYQAMVAGHTFCGSVEVPGTPRLAWFNSEVVPGTPDPMRTRIYRLRGATVFITCGVGFSYIPVRFGAPPEVALITLRGLGVAKPDSAAIAAAATTDSLMQVYTAQDSNSRAGIVDTAGEPREP